MEVSEYYTIVYNEHKYTYTKMFLSVLSAWLSWPMKTTRVFVRNPGNGYS